MPQGLLYRCHCLIFLMAISGTSLYAQVIFLSEEEFNEAKESFERSAGPDFNLLNGRQYNLPYSRISHPYFNSESYRPGSLRLNGEDYDSVMINYDIYNQQIILQHRNSSGQIRNIILNGELIDHFTLDGRTFRKLSFPVTGNAFFQVVTSGQISCYLYWEKNLYRSSSSTTTPFKYSEQSRDIYITREGRVHLVRDRSSFIEIFEKGYENEIKRYIRRERIRFRNASGKSLVELIEYCSGLVNNG